MPKLRRLNLDKTKITDKGVQFLTGNPNLVWLHVGSTGIGDAVVPSLLQLPKLQYLNVTYTQLSDAKFWELYDALTARKCTVVGP